MLGLMGKRNTTAANLGFGAVVSGFDSTGSDMHQSAQQLSTAERRAHRSVVEEARLWGILIVSSLIMSIAEGDLGDDLASDRLDALMLSALGDSDDEEGAFWQLIEGAVSDAFETLGVDETVVSDIFGDDVELADTSIEAAAQTALSNLPDDGEPMDHFVSEFVYGDEDEAGFDAANPVKSGSKKDKAKLGAFSARNVGGKKIAYRGTAVIRNGKRTIVNKRLPNQKVRLSVKQRANLKNLKIKAQRADSIKKRVISFKKGKRMGLY